MDETKAGLLAETVKQWAQSHPSPEVPAVRILGRGVFSPAQISEEILRRSDVGLILLSVLESAVEASSLEAVLQSFEDGEATAAAHGD